METYFERAQTLSQEITANRRHLHHNPELGMNMEQTAGFVMQKLTELGYTPQRVGKCGVTATVGQVGGQVFLLRADMDALPIQEESGLDFASQIPDRAHCCGHDLHTAMLLGAAHLLKEREQDLKGLVKFMFQPGEETMEGALDMIDGGVLESPHVDAALSIHVNSMTPSGKLLVFQGPACASSDLFSITIRGKGGHGARPEETIDPINVACHIHTALQTLQAREVKSGEVGVLTIGSIQGGQAHNVIPDTTEMLGTIRTYSKELRATLLRRLEEISTQVAAAFHATVDVQFCSGNAIPLVADEVLAPQVRDALAQLFGQAEVHTLTKRFSASEDFAFVADKVPSSFVILGAAVPNAICGQHHPRVRFNEDCLPVGAAAYAQAATQWLLNHK